MSDTFAACHTSSNAVLENYCCFSIIIIIIISSSSSSKSSSSSISISSSIVNQNYSKCSSVCDVTPCPQIPLSSIIDYKICNYFSKICSYELTRITDVNNITIKK